MFNYLQNSTEFGGNTLRSAHGSLDEQETVSSASLASSVIVSFLGAAMANSAGVGGGAIFVPIFNIVLRQDLKHATGLSQVMVTAGALVGVLLNFNKRSPLEPHRPLIEVDFVLLLMPAMLLGISVGVLFNVALEVWLQKILMVSLYVYLASVTLQKGISLFRQEMRTKRQEREQGPDTQADWYQPLPEQEPPPEDRPAARDPGAPGEDAAVAEAGGSSGPRRDPHSGATWAVLVALWALYFCFSIMHHTRPFCVRCSPAFWGLYASMAAVTLAVTGAALAWLAKKHAPQRHAALADGEDGAKAADSAPGSGREPAPGQLRGIDWSPRNLVRCTVVMCAAGVVAGLMGIGGGMIMSPMLLALHVHPQVTAATSSMMVLFSSSAAFLQLSLEGLVDPWLALWFGATAMIASASGITLVRRIISRFGTTSIIVLVLGIFIACAAAVIMVSEVVELYAVDRGTFVLFANICSAALETAASCLN